MSSVVEMSLDREKELAGLSFLVSSAGEVGRGWP